VASQELKEKFYGRFQSQPLEIPGLHRAASTRCEAAGLKTDGQIITSKDDGAAALKRRSVPSNVPKGIQKWQLPVHLDNTSHHFIYSSPNRMLSHQGIRHKDGDGIRFIGGWFDHLRRKRTWPRETGCSSGGKAYSFQVGRTAR